MTDSLGEPFYFAQHMTHNNFQTKNTETDQRNAMYKDMMLLLEKNCSNIFL